MRFAHPKTQEVFESLSEGAQEIVRAAVHGQKGMRRGLLISEALISVSKESPSIALKEVLFHIREKAIMTLLPETINGIYVEVEVPACTDVFEVKETKYGPVLKVKHPEKPQDQIRAEEAARLQYELERSAYANRKAELRAAK